MKWIRLLHTCCSDVGTPFWKYLNDTLKKYSEKEDWETMFRRVRRLTYENPIDKKGTLQPADVAGNTLGPKLFLVSVYCTSSSDFQVAVPTPKKQTECPPPAAGPLCILCFKGKYSLSHVKFLCVSTALSQNFTDKCKQ